MFSCFAGVGRLDHLPERELLGGRYPQESQSKNNVCQGINVTEKGYYPSSYIGFTRGTGLVGPFIDNIIYKIYNKSNADQEFRVTQQPAIVMGDHEIDLVDAEQDDKRATYNPEIRAEIDHPAEDEIFGYPNGAGDRQDQVGQVFPGPEEPPNAELPENQDPFQKGIRIGDAGIADLPVIDEVMTKAVSDQSCQAHQKEGLISFTDTAETNQPRDAGYGRNYKA
jgi:hypothetical protein